MAECKQATKNNGVHQTHTFVIVRRVIFALEVTNLSVTADELQMTYFKCKPLRKVIIVVITLCMKLSWFCHTNSGQLFCNCPLFVIALVPGLFFGGKPDETCCHSVVASKWLETRVSHFALQDENTTT